jgi:hypothetical protein
MLLKGACVRDLTLLLLLLLLCLASQLVNNPKLLALPGASQAEAVTPAPAASLTVAGCATKDVLGLDKPSVVLTQLTPVRATPYTWKVEATAEPGFVLLKANRLGCGCVAEQGMLPGIGQPDARPQLLKECPGLAPITLYTSNK